VFYLAAAVSDFYVPWVSLPEHKLQSQNGALTLEMAPVPKCIDLIQAKWAPGAFVVSFKLETNKELLEPKAESALLKHNAHCVVANLLETRKDECVTLLLCCAVTKQSGSLISCSAL
jgi:phosphopantothenate-cysteine ligase